MVSSLRVAWSAKLTRSYATPDYAPESSMSNQMQVIINEETIKQANQEKAGRPKKGDRRPSRRPPRGYKVSDEAHAAIQAAAARMGVSASAFVEALGRSLACEKAA